MKKNKEKPLKIKLEFAIEEDAPFKGDIIRKFNELLQILEKSNKEIMKDDTKNGSMKYAGAEIERKTGSGKLFLKDVPPPQEADMI